jgi:TIR domain
LWAVGKIREISLPNAGRIELWVGDITAMTAADGCDVLVVSAYPGDYQYAPRAWPSVIRSLANRGIPVAELGADPEIDLRSTTSCWLSRKMPPGRRSGFDRLLCFEPPAAHTAASTVGDIFRTLVPFVGPEIGIRDVAMPIVASGNMGVPREEMLTAILTAATRWMEFGLPLQRLRIFIRYYDDNDPAIAVFDDFARRVQPQNGESTPPLPTDMRDATVFISYAHADGRPSADAIRSYISAAAPKVRTLMDAVSIDVGSYWQSRIGDLIEDSNRVIFVVTEGFWQSKVCLEEYGMARVLDHERGGGVLFPIYALSCDLPLHFKILNYEDCREADHVRIRSACDRMLATLNSR